ncbi:MAG: cyclic pyranopterin monophosphate synthase MoaC [Anaerovoracaceae bacterium]|jgi:cyclic pyranopterin phosphate synthase
MGDFSHFNEEGRAKMVHVGEKEITERKGVARGRIRVNEETFRLIETGGMKKGDVLNTAQIAGIMGAKKTPDMIPMCHPLLLTGVDLDFVMDREDLGVEVTATVRCSGKTGVEMEALTAVSVALLTIYDMCKAVQKDMVIEEVKLLSKEGGKSGTYTYTGEENEK